MSRIERAISPGLVCLLAVVAACERETTVSDLPAGPRTGTWQALIEVPGGEIETTFELARDAAGYRASLVNGQERLKVDEVSFDDGELLLRFPVYNNEIRARLDDGRLLGELILLQQFGDVQRLPFRATYGGEHAHEVPDNSARSDLSGRWAVEFVDEDGSVSPSIGQFAQRGSRLFGTFVNPDGDHRYLAGHVSGSQLRLSTFDGAHAYLFTAIVQGDRIVDGHFWSGDHWHQQWSGRRDPQASLPDAFSRTRLKEGFDTLEFAFPNHDGEIVSHADDRFAGKARIVMLGGTWCPNCNDEARYINALHQQYGNQGLEVIALMFEHFEEPELAAEQVRMFRDKNEIGYHTLIAGVSDKADAAAKLPALETVHAFPTTVFIDRSGRVKAIHAGFAGPGTGEYYEQLKQRFSTLVAELLAGQSSPPESDTTAPGPETASGEA